MSAVCCKPPAQQHKVRTCAARFVGLPVSGVAAPRFLPLFMSCMRFTGLSSRCEQENLVLSRSWTVHLGACWALTLSDKTCSGPGLAGGRGMRVSCGMALLNPLQRQPRGTGSNRGKVSKSSFGSWAGALAQTNLAFTTNQGDLSRESACAFKKRVQSPLCGALANASIRQNAHTDRNKPGQNSHTVCNKPRPEVVLRSHSVVKLQGPACNQTDSTQCCCLIADS